MKYMKLKCAALLVMLTILLALPVQAKVSTKSKALKAYKKMLAGSRVQWDVNSSWSVSTSGVQFAIAYIDKNTVPELILYSGNVPHIAGYGFLYTYKNGRAVPVGNVNIDDKIAVYKKKGILVEVYDQGGYTTRNYVLLSGTTKQTVLKESRSMSGAKTYYSVSNGRSAGISKKEFKKALRDYIGSKKQTKVTFYKNTASNRKQRIK